MNRANWRVHSALLFVQVTFGGFHVFGKAILSYLPPLVVAGIRVATGAPLLLLLAWHFEHTFPKKRDFPYLILLGGLGVVANQLLFIIGLSHTTATNAAILMPSIPVFTTAIAAIAGVEKVRPLQVGGIALALAGAFVMLDPSQISWEGGKATGNILIIMNCIFYAGYLVLQRPVLKRLPPVTVVAWAYFFGMLGVLPFSVGPLFRLELSQVPAIAYWGMLYIILIPTVLNYFLITWAISHTSPSMVAAYSLLQPLAAATLAAVFLGESAGWSEAAGFVLIVAGLALVSRQSSVNAKSQNKVLTGQPTELEG